MQESGYDFDATVKSLKDASNSAEKVDQLPVDGPGWIDLAIGEMRSATSVDDARARAAKVLEGFEKSTSARVFAEIAQTKCQKEEENNVLKEQKESLVEENSFLKRFVYAQNEQHKEYEGRDQELKNLKDLVAQQMEQLRTLEVNNHGLKLHLNEALRSTYSNFRAGGFNPDVF